MQRDVAGVVHVLPPPPSERTVSSHGSSIHTTSVRESSSRESASTENDAIRVGIERLRARRSALHRDASKDVHASAHVDAQPSSDTASAVHELDVADTAAPAANETTRSTRRHEPAVAHARAHAPATVWFSINEATTTEHSIDETTDVDSEENAPAERPAVEVTTANSKAQLHAGPAQRKRAAGVELTSVSIAPPAVIRSRSTEHETTAVSLAPPPVVRSRSTEKGTTAVNGAPAPVIEKPGVFSRLFGALTARHDGTRKKSENDIVPLPEPSRDEALLLELINVERTSRGIAPVRWDGMLAQIARLHAADMSSVHKMSHHSSRDGADFEARLSRSAYSAKGAAENVAYNSDVMRAHRALMDSPGHRRNILDPTLTSVGPGVMSEPSGEWVYVAEDFATPMPQVTDDQAAARIAKLLEGARSRSRSTPLVEDRAMSKQLNRQLEKMIASGAVRGTESGSVGWTLAFTSMDLSAPPPGALEHVSEASSYGLAVTFRKTKQYPLGTYWAILFLGGEEASRTTASATPAGATTADTTW